MSLGLYDECLRSPGTRLFIRFGDGRFEPLAVDKWTGILSRADESLTRRARGASLDVGCGPGRITAALRGRGLPSLGIDIAPEAVALTQRSGGEAILSSVFGPVPNAQCWQTILLVDGNIGIGGDPARLLRRCRSLLAPGGRVLAELEPLGAGRRSVQARLEELDGRQGAWFPWALVGIDAIGPLCVETGMRAVETWSVADEDGCVRHFASLAAQS
jgi:SAM-dependent methyltransferase